uniref:THAP-type domain-containing protein n=1 Tax=Cacopsylla melanoneura TaxID=428564 RepID=A0A8D8T928_9HEMI
MDDHTYSAPEFSEFTTDELPSYPEGSNEGNKRHWCFIPKCTNTGVNSPNKWFIPVPNDIKLKKLWFEKVRRPYNVSNTTKLYACEDHFDVSLKKKVVDTY